jgi:hypothetical protein
MVSDGESIQILMKDLQDKALKLKNKERLNRSIVVDAYQNN